jgi:hypothetical protein
MSSTNGALTAQQQNQLARAAINQASLPMTAQIFAQTVVPANNPTLTIAPRNVGLIRGFWVKVAGTITNSGNAAITPSNFNVANLLSNITLVDFNNQTRINAPGWYLDIVNTLKYRSPYGGTLGSSTPVKYGNNIPVIVCPTTIAAGANAPVVMWYYVPASYTKKDLRGAIFANVYNATAQLSITFNTTNVSVATGADQGAAVFTGAAGAVFSSATVTVYQDYLDQLPTDANGNTILPIVDISTIYELKQTSLNGLTAGQDFAIPFSNFRSFLSTTLLFDNGGQYNNGSDINYLALQSANTTNIFKIEPALNSLWTRREIYNDMPPGCYYFDHRDKPLNTNQYGNLQLILNPNLVNAGATILVGYEDFGLINTVSAAGSLASS